MKRKRRVVKAVVNTATPISQLGIEVPQIDYKVVADVTMQKVFTGRITPIPTVLVHFLRPVELLFVSTIIEEIVLHGECTLTTMEFTQRVGVAAPTIYIAKTSLRRMGLLQEERLTNKRYRYCINWVAVNKLESLTVNEPHAIMTLIRKATQKNVIENLTKDDVRKSYTERVLPLGHDPREEETYD